nr:hypothetical protein [Tanacetum cinerariifolium]
MKIFNWVHRRFINKCEAGQDVTKGEHTGNRKNKLALLETEVLDSVFNGWNEGILAIGTFGFDPALLKDFEPEGDTYLCDTTSKDSCVADGGDNDDKGYQKGEMEFPLVLKACNHGFLSDQKHDNPQCDTDSELIKYREVDGLEDNDLVKEAKNAGERITLADLFWADSEKNLLKNKKLADEDHVKLPCDTAKSNTKGALNDDNVGLISKKKLIKDNTDRPIKKINRMVRKMLKKKIHPDVENQKEITHMKPMRITQSVKNAL